MIDFIEGKIAYIYDEYLAININGVGYQIYNPRPRTFAVGEEMLFFVHQVIREDANTLYGFGTLLERDLFCLLLSVAGVGPKVGLDMLSMGQPPELVAAISNENVEYLTSIPGIGKKTAQRLILELKDKFKKMSQFSKLTNANMTTQATPLNTCSKQADVEAALRAFGYTQQESARATALALEDGHSMELSTAELIKKALAGVGS